MQHRALILIGIGALIIIAGAFSLAQNSRTINTTESTIEHLMQDTDLILSSGDFEQGTAIPSRFTCDGDNMSPPLTWSGVPKGTMSLALTLDDPDAPSGNFDHWVMFNVPPNTNGILTGGDAAGVLGANGTGKSEYIGPCPPSGTHRYFFRLYALDTELSLKEGASKGDVLKAMEGHVLGQTELMGTYQRQQ